MTSEESVDKTQVRVMMVQAREVALRNIGSFGILDIF